MTVVSTEDFASDYTDCVFPSERAAGLWFQREASRHGTPLQIQTAWEANDNEMGELKKFYDDCEVRFCVKVLIQQETVLKPCVASSSLQDMKCCCWRLILCWQKIRRFFDWSGNLNDHYLFTSSIIESSRYTDFSQLHLVVCLMKMFSLASTFFGVKK